MEVPLIDRFDPFEIIEALEMWYHEEIIEAAQLDEISWVVIMDHGSTTIGVLELEGIMKNYLIHHPDRASYIRPSEIRASDIDRYI